MGSVGNIEKVMVFGILAIILLILAVAITGAQDDPSNIDDWASGGENPTVPPLRSEVPGAPEVGSDRRSDHGPDPIVTIDPKGDLASNDGWETINPVDLRPQTVMGGGDDLPPAPPSSGARRRTYTVKSGDTFGSIAQRLLGGVRYADDLQKSNEDVDAKKIHVGQVLNLPLVGNLVSGGSRQEAGTRADSGPSGPAVALSTRTHRVAKGDTLYGISRKYFGTVGRWKDILSANGSVLSKPEALTPGMVLSIPSLP